MFPDNFIFHHIAIASNNIDKEFNSYKLLGYTKEGNPFTDKVQGVKGQFITANKQPRIELLENIEGSHTLDVLLNNNIKMYHLAYYANDFDKSIEFFIHNKAKIIKSEEKSVYFKNKICFLMLANMSLIELIEYTPPPPKHTA